jgi:hypothetical protein
MANYYGTASLEVFDAYGIPGQVMINVEIPDSATVAQIATDVAAFATNTNPLTQGALGKASLRLQFPGGGESPADGLGDIEKGALFNFNNATDGYAYGILVPDPDPGILNGAGLVDLTNSDVTTWITWITTAHTAITVITKGVRALTALRDALINFRKHRKPLTRKTKEV